MMFLQQLVTQLSEWMSKGENFVPALFLALLVYIISRFILDHFNHRAEKRDQRYKRSSETKNIQFEKEVTSIQELSNALLKLVMATEGLSECGLKEGVSDDEDNAWEDAHNQAIDVLGKAAPFLNYLDFDSGAMSCGVRLGESLDSKKNLGRYRGYEHMCRFFNVSDRRSLYMRAALLIDACTYKAGEKASVKGAKGREAIIPKAGFVVEDRIFKADKQSLRERAKFRDNSCKQLGCQVDPCESEDLPDDYENLRERYHQFLNCAFCRLQDAEKSTDYARKKRIKKWRTSWVRSLFPTVCGYFDAQCAFDNEGSDHGCDMLGQEDVAEAVSAQEAVAEEGATGSVDKGLLRSLKWPEFARVIVLFGAVSFLVGWLVVQFLGTTFLVEIYNSGILAVPVLALLSCVALMVVFRSISIAMENGRKEVRKALTKLAKPLILCLLSFALFIIPIVALCFGSNIGSLIKGSVDDYSWDELSCISQEISMAPDEEAALEIAKNYNLCTPEGRLDGTQVKDVELTDGGCAKVQIAGFWHDSKTEGGKAGITFIFKDAIAIRDMDDDTSETDDWANSKMRSWLASDAMCMLPEELRDNLVMVNKSSKIPEPEEDGPKSTVTCDKLWLYSVTEIYGATEVPGGSYGYVPSKREYGYQLFRDIGSNGGEPSNAFAKSLDGEPCEWWLRTPVPGDKDEFYSVGTDGGLSGGSSAQKDLGVVPGFCI